MRSGVRKKLDDLNLYIESAYRGYVIRKDVRETLKKLHGGCKCDEDYKKIVVPYWKKYGVKPNKMWYQLWWNDSEKHDPRYIPDDMWAGTIVPYFSNTQFRRFGEDKCLHAVWFKDLKRPMTLAMNIAGVYYNADYEIITEDQALDNCFKAEKFLIKPSIDSGEGRLIRFFEAEKVSKEELRNSFSQMHANFIVQEEVKQHADLARLNPSSLNSIRVISFLFKGEVHILSTIVRIGAAGSKVDNVGAGGYGCRIMPDGTLDYRGVNKRGEWVTETEKGISFAGVKIPSFDRVIDLVKHTHQKLAHFKLIGWDFSVDQYGDPVFIEYNVYPGANQFTCGPTFGDLTDEVLEEVFIKKELKYSQN